MTPLTVTIAARAAGLRAGYDRLRLPDAIVLETARELDGDLLTYNDRLARVGDKSND